MLLSRRGNLKFRMIYQLLVFFIIGIILSYAVAWGCAAYGGYYGLTGFFCYKARFSRGVGKQVEPSNALEEVYLYNGGFGVESCTQYRCAEGDPLSRRERLGDFVSIAEELRYGDPSIPSRNEIATYSYTNETPVLDEKPLALQLLLSDEFDSQCSIFIAGWPFRCVESHHSVEEFFSAAFIEQGPWSSVIQFEVVLDVVGLKKWTPLPNSPLYLNLAINSLFYGTLAYGLWVIPGVLKRRRRMRRGLCPQCKYDLRGDHDAGCPECGWGRATESTEVRTT